KPEAFGLDDLGAFGIRCSFLLAPIRLGCVCCGWIIRILLLCKPINFGRPAAIEIGVAVFAKGPSNAPTGYQSGRVTALGKIDLGTAIHGSRDESKPQIEGTRVSHCSDCSHTTREGIKCASVAGMLQHTVGSNFLDRALR